MTARAVLTGAAWAAEIAAIAAILLAPVPWWAVIALAVAAVSGVAATTRQGALPDGGQDFLALRLWDVAVLYAGGVPLGEARAQCFSNGQATPPCQEGNQP